MKLYNVKNVERLFSEIEKCKGNVELITSDGIYNLKSKLSQIAASAKLFSGSNVKELELKLSDENDCMRMLQYCLSGM